MTPSHSNSERKPPNHLPHHKRRSFGKENPPVLLPKTFVNSLVSTIERRSNSPTIGRLIHDYYYSSLAHAWRVRHHFTLDHHGQEWKERLKKEYKRAAAFGQLAQRHTNFINLNDYTYLQVCRVRPGPLSRVDRYHG